MVFDCNIDIEYVMNYSKSCKLNGSMMTACQLRPSSKERHATILVNYQFSRLKFGQDCIRSIVVDNQCHSDNA